MPYTDAQLQAIYTQLNIGSPGPAVDQAAVAAIAAQTRVGQISDEQALQAVFDLVDDTTGVAALTYQFFTSNLPTEAGFQFLVNSATNPNDLNDAYYANFNAENRFINFSLNLALGTPANQTAFAAVFGGATTLQQAVALAYDTIIGNAAAQAAGINPAEAVAFLTNTANVNFYRSVAIGRGGIPATDTVRLDLAIKAIAIAELLYAATTSDVGNYAASLDQFYRSLIDATPGSPGFGNDLLESFPPSATVTLTAFADTVTANVFNAPRTFTPGGNDQVNTLNDDDILTGVGTNPTLNFTFVNDSDTGDSSIAPTLNNISTINVDFRTDFDATLDLQDATGVTSINVRGIDGGNAYIDNIQSIPANLSITNTNAPDFEVGFLIDEDALTGTADVTKLTLNNVELDSILLEDASFGFDEGIETINLVSLSNNEIGTIETEDLRTLNISGSGSLTLGFQARIVNASNNVEGTVYGASLPFAAGSLTLVDASTYTGNLDISFGTEVVANLDDTSGTPVDFVFKGGSGNDIVRAIAGLDSNADTFDGGGGKNTFQVFQSVTAGSITKFQALDVRNQGLGGGTIKVDTSLFGADLATVNVRNEGNVYFGGATAQPDPLDSTVILDKLAAAPAAAITVQHGTTFNNGIDFNTVAAILATASGASDTVGVTIANGVNLDPRFNLEFVTSNVENITITDSDTESNTVLLGANGLSPDTTGGSRTSDISGTLKIVGGNANTFLNLDASLSGFFNSAGNATRGAYGYDASGAAVDDNYGAAGNRHDLGAAATAIRITAATIDASAALSSIIVRVSDAASAAGVFTATGGQKITMGSGNDTVIFDRIGDTRAGLTISDTVAGGTGTDILAIDGEGVQISIGASEWTNVSGFETIRLIGNNITGGAIAGVVNNGGNAVAPLVGDNFYNLTLTNDLIDNNGQAAGAGRFIKIVNDNDQTNTVIGADDPNAGVNWGVTIDARSLDAKHSFSYDGEEGLGATTDRFVMSDANINGTATIDGGFINAVGTTSNVGNNDVLEVRNGAVVTVGDLANVKNVGTLQFTNDTATIQSSVLELNSTVIDALVNSTRSAAAGFVETLKIVVSGNPVLPLATTELTIEDAGVTSANTKYVVFVEGNGAVTINNAGSGNGLIVGDGANNTIVGGVGDDNIAGNGGNDTLTGGAGADTLEGGAGIDTIKLGPADGAQDLVVFRNIGDGPDLITGWEDGVDRIALAGPLAAAFDDLGAAGTYAFLDNNTNNDDAAFNLAAFEGGRVSFSENFTAALNSTLLVDSVTAASPTQAASLASLLALAATELETEFALVGDSVGEDAIFTIASFDTSGVVGIFGWTSLNGDGVIDANELTLLGVINGGASSGNAPGGIGALDFVTAP